jgi:hypothetical protein
MRNAAFVLIAAPMMLLGCDGTELLAPAGSADVRLAAVTAGEARSAPSSASAVAWSDVRIDIRWLDNSRNEAGFEVHRSTTGEDGTFVVLATTGADVVAHIDAEVEPGTLYCYRIRALRVVGSRSTYSAFSNTACAVPVLPPPSNASAVALSDTQIGISWQDNSSLETGFEIQREADDAIGTFVLLATTAPDTDAWTDAGLVADRRYCYRIRAVRVIANDTASSVFSTACAATLRPLPDAVRSLSAIPFSSTGVSVSPGVPPRTPARTASIARRTAAQRGTWSRLFPTSHSMITRCPASSWCATV